MHAQLLYLGELAKDRLCESAASLSCSCWLKLAKVIPLDCQSLSERALFFSIPESDKSNG